MSSCSCSALRISQCKRSSERLVRCPALSHCGLSGADLSVFPVERFSSTSPPTTSFLAYLAATLPDSPHKRLRFKTILFLQGSPFYDVDLVHEKLEKDPAVPYLSFERAIIFGKVRVPASFSALLDRPWAEGIFQSYGCTTKRSLSSPAR